MNKTVKKTMYEPVIGLEVHAQIATRTKMFCRCTVDSWKLGPNEAVCPVCMGFPGQLPVLNVEAVRLGILAALALNCSIPKISKFDRKNYFYPDLPKGFQISQYDQPVGIGGRVDIEVCGEIKSIRINRLHLEDDAGKLTHTPRGTLCDFNRSGMPLMEIVSEADLFSVEEASAYARELQKILRTCDASKCDMEKGMMRFDINVSLRPGGQKEFGTKVEVKNLNSFRSLEAALRYEIQRQEEVLRDGGKIAQETRGWLDDKFETVSQRSKEEAHDYRYFPEPDLPPLAIKDEHVEELKAGVPELPLARRQRFVSEYGLSEVDAKLLTDDAAMAVYFEEAARHADDRKKIASFIISILLKHLNENGIPISESPISSANLGGLVTLVVSGKLNMNIAKAEVFEEMYKTGESASEVMVHIGIDDSANAVDLVAVCDNVIAQNKKAADQIRQGKGEVFAFLIGQVMKETRGRANPADVQKLLREKLGA